MVEQGQHHATRRALGRALQFLARSTRLRLGRLRTSSASTLSPTSGGSTHFNMLGAILFALGLSYIGWRLGRDKTLAVPSIWLPSFMVAQQRAASSS